MWFSVFIAWAIKSTVLKYGGLGFFERLKPFFLGLILGEAVVAGFWVVVDFCTGMQSNRLGNIYPSIYGGSGLHQVNWNSPYHYLKPVGSGG